MRHRIAGYRLGRSSAHRTALRRNLITDLFRHERIRTTRTKADAIRGAAERLITLAKNGNAAGEAKAVHARRLANARLNDPVVVRKLFEDIAPRYAERPGGYTRMLKLGPRLGDAAAMVILELVEE
ncbi:MAG: 50S ribosomal protein L17 [Chloroflexi bacterium RBG_19FT_COMBO_62_14]|uniref:Large ribosomal subunit protein bL17 n=1 Tax=uncultured Chloroflexi bacterium Rifle_16ft_4_minimus_38099 TaxID=1665073 RepID=A0A0H4T9U0_9CHLR|nr:50S ribosomal protein L17, large subunit ribosomal protein L17 [uncultured Chloroflexi bacterium Rifle_16ft_4_minimus_38099]OGO69166.1 MAG: 50S ribosomal protein L17 [Chloroflexi bacterium RBG_19FT_COMBO_62_14]